MFKFDHVAISVFDLKKSICFYQNFGFVLEQVFQDEEYEWATLRLGDHSLEIFSYKNSMGKCKNDLKDIGVDHFALQTENIESIIKEIEKMYSGEIEIYDGDLKRKSFWIRDPDGIGIQIIEAKKRIKK